MLATSQPNLTATFTLHNSLRSSQCRKQATFTIYLEVDSEKLSHRTLSTMSQTLPPKLLDQIVNLACSDLDARTIGACALVCKCWSFAYRPRLFHTVLVNRQDACARLVSLLSSSPTIAAYVRKLCLVTNTDNDHSGEPWAHLVPLLLSVELPNADVLLFRGVRFDEMGVTLGLLASLSRLASVTELRLHHCCFATLGDMQGLLDGPSETSQKTVSHTLRLRALRVKRSAPGLSALLAWLLTTWTWCTLQTAEFPKIEDEETDAVYRLLYASGASLRDVTIGFSSNSIPNQGPGSPIISRATRESYASASLSDPTVMLAGCEALASLRIVNIDFTHGRLSWVPHLLSGITSARLQSVALEICADDPRDLDGMHWRRVEEALRSRHFVALDRLEVVVLPWKTLCVDELCREVERRLSYFDCCGMLEVTSRGST
ncbi:hypothetical protein A0H81_13495 [Grifola frondosa]|uniref:F-box domain-containing protein n=1 Tax=Grifola frondosa TaxID=5627 RepID=A0A1C7LQ19_GRIFR|nr:hypothetical protein A0H81_13495 [Grifola frondosa]